MNGLGTSASPQGPMAVQQPTISKTVKSLPPSPGPGPHVLRAAALGPAPLGPAHHLGLAPAAAVPRSRAPPRSSWSNSSEPRPVSSRTPSPAALPKVASPKVASPKTASLKPALPKTPSLKPALPKNASSKQSRSKQSRSKQSRSRSKRNSSSAQNKYESIKSVGPKECRPIMCKAGLTSKKEAAQWLLKHHPDQGGEPTSIDLSSVTKCMSKKHFCEELEKEENARKANEDESLGRVFERAQFKSPLKTAVDGAQEVAYQKNAKQLQCVRQVSNWSKIGPESRFDKKRFNLERTDKLIPIASPKIEALLQNIEALDKADMITYGHKFKHFIFSDIKLMGYGSKIIAAAMIARGWQNVLKQVFRKTKRGNQKSYIDIEVPKKVSDRNFAVLSSTPMWDAPFSHALKKEVLSLYNSRPDNVHGEQCRVIVLDSGFKEGIDLFDVRYVHLFEPLMTAADQTQALGRATRLCGQKGLDFVPNVGWPLHVFKYSQSIPEQLQPLFKAKTMFEIMLQLKGLDTRLHRITKSINDISILAAVDQPLTEEIHKSGLLPHIEIKPATKESLEVVRTEERVQLSADHLSRVDLLNANAKTLLLEDGPMSETISDQDVDPCAPIDPERCDKLSIVPFPPSRLSQLTISPVIVSENNVLVLRQPTVPPKAVKGIPTTWFELRRYVVDNFGKMSWGKQEIVNKCGPPAGGAKIGVLGVGKADAAAKAFLAKGLKLNGKTAKAKKVIQLKKGTATAKAKAGPAKAATAKAATAKAGPAKAGPAKAGPAKAKKGKTKKNELRSSGIPAPPKRNKLPALKLIDYTPTQDFVSSYFKVQSPIKGMLLWHSVGTGKTCTAIALASRQFEPAGYTILWVTRHTLKGDIWKNIFEQVCHAAVADEVRRGVLKPQDVEKRQRKMFDNWIPPMSYRQFSNLVTARNPLFKVLVERNGKADPLRKTLIVIDEAHKLYSADFKGAEKPDVNAFRKALQTSYNVSGADSARVLLMTATPYNESPIELMNLLNLCRVKEKWLPETIPEFIEKYMDDKGNFSKDGLHQYMDDIAGQISYLNREADPSQFAQPVFAEVVVPISTYDMEGTDNNEILQGILKDIEDLESEHHDLETNTIPYLEQQVGLIQPALDSYLRECAETHAKPKDVKACQKRVEKTYKAALKLETKNLKDAKKQFESIDKNKRKLEKRFKSTTLKLRKMSMSQQGQFEGKCKLGQEQPKPRTKRATVAPAAAANAQMKGGFW